ncbi:hypothetical protein F0562_004199 [Nyssa sinensis]|uniref:C3H1-type domain-containing protein n=1 Tax=Nyssa sinensis TaxID=561372 RepID=A0A5J5C0R9_9ASTE|nr:hypothetical protein F0562_004199 [Nyssa sinensis]
MPSYMPAFSFHTCAVPLPLSLKIDPLGSLSSNFRSDQMQDVPPSDGGNNNNNDKSSSTNSSPHLSRNSDSIDFTSFYPSMFLPNSNSLSITPSDCSFDDDNTNAISTEDRLYQASAILEYQQLYNRYAMCLAHLQRSIKQIDALRQENDDLRLANSDLVKRLSLLSQATIQNCLLSSHHPSLSFINDFNRLSIGGTVRDSHVAEEISTISPTSVIEHNRLERKNVERVSLPKSISVRSSGYLKINQRGGNTGGPSRNRVANPVSNGSQRVYVPRGKREEALEFDLYNQGMIKTELCNKWQETGACPYGNHCQFAHGITELRPVIRHPRYKTEVCRMVLAGDTCPYGHRCHFRHTLTDQERLLGPL